MDSNDSQWERKVLEKVALEAIAEDEEAASSIGINISRNKMGITLLSALMTCVGGILYAQYQLYVNPQTVASLTVSLQIVFGAIAGGMFVMLDVRKTKLSGEEFHGVLRA